VISRMEERNMTVQDSWNMPSPTNTIGMLTFRAVGGHDWDYVGKQFVPRKCGNRDCKTCGVKK